MFSPRNGSCPQPVSQTRTKTTEIASLPRGPALAEWRGNEGDLSWSSRARSAAARPKPEELIYQKYHSLHGHQAGFVPGHYDHVHLAY